MPYNQTTYGYGYTQITSLTALKGKVTATVTRVLDPIDGMRDSIRTVNYYDKYGRIIQTVSDNHTNGREIVSQLYKYKNSEQVEKTKYCHWKSTTTGSPTHVIEQLFTYDHAGRLKSTDEIINSNKVRMSEMVYSEDGRLQAKRIGNSLQTMDYKYITRGWLSEINKPYTWGAGAKLFNMWFRYGENDFAEQPNYSGNIVEMIWSDNEGKIGYYGFNYDRLNRLKSGYYWEEYQGNWVNTADNKYNVGFTYDANGNILTANRRGIVNDATGLIGDIDLLTYKYFNGGKSNRLWAVGDEAADVYYRGDFWEYSDGIDYQEYSYDNNGNMKWDDNRWVTNIYYNYLNLPYIMEDGDTREFYRLSYNANGMKLRQKSNEGTCAAYDYIGPFIYKNNVLDYIITSEGRAVFASGTFSYYEYNLKDHLGNVRVTFKNNNGTAEVLQRNDYYPFGLLMGERYQTPGTNKNQYLYNGKEILSDTDLDWYDYGARMYDPQLGRWHTLDPKAEEYRRWSTYNYCVNNPLKFTDPDGMGPTTDFQDKTGKLIKHIDNGSNAVFQQKGEKQDLHYEFVGYNGNETEVHLDDPSKPTSLKNEVNVTTAIQEQQNLNMENPDLQEEPNGQTWCNRATFNVINTAESAMNASESALGPVSFMEDANLSLPMANANSSADALASGKYNYKTVDKTTASSEAKNGNLVVLAYKNPGGTGHLATLSVGANISKVSIANIGPAAYTGFVTLNQSFAASKQSSIVYYVIDKK